MAASPVAAPLAVARREAEPPREFELRRKRGGKTPRSAVGEGGERSLARCDDERIDAGEPVDGDAASAVPAEAEGTEAPGTEAEGTKERREARCDCGGGRGDCDVSTSLALLMLLFPLLVVGDIDVLCELWLKVAAIS